MIELDVKGVADTERILRTLGQRIVRNVVVQSTRAGINEMRTVARKLAPVDTGLLRRRLGTSVKVNRVTGTAVGTLKGKRTKGQRRKGEAHTNRYLHLVVAGTKAHTIPGPVSLNGKVYSNINHPGSKANPFMDRAASLGARPSVQVFQRKLTTRTNEETRKLRATQNDL